MRARGREFAARRALRYVIDAVTERLIKRAEIEGRSDDNEEAIRQRIRVYEEQTAPLLDVLRPAADQARSRKPLRRVPSPRYRKAGQLGSSVGTRISFRPAATRGVIKARIDLV